VEGFAIERGEVRAVQNHKLLLNDMTVENCNSGGLRILVVENDAEAADSMVILLLSFGHRVQVAYDGQSALQAAQSGPPDVVLLQLSLPDLNAWELAECLQGPFWEKRPFLIALADHDREEDRCRSRDAGIDLHLVKPVASDFLGRLLRRFWQIITPTDATGKLPPSQPRSSSGVRNA
jgi:CheY-like chemotaxis protein